MPSCAALGCNNSGKKGFLMKRFPKDPLRRETWAMNVKRGNDWQPTDHSCLCEVHFAPEMWEKPRVDGKRILKASAIPTIFSSAEVRTKTRRKSPVQMYPLSPKKPELSSDEALVLLPPVECLYTSSADSEVDLPATQKSSTTSLPSEEKTAALLLEINKSKDIITELQAKLNRYEKYYVRERNKALRYKNLLRQARSKLQAVQKIKDDIK